MTEPKVDSTARPGVRRVMEALAGVSGQRFFDALCGALARSCGARVALAATVQGADLALLSRVEDGRIVRDGRTSLAESPWAAALSSGSLAAESGAHARFPGDPWVAGCRADALLAVAIPARGTAPRGVLAVLDPGRIDDAPRALSLLGFAALRAASELERNPPPWAEPAFDEEVDRAPGPAAADTPRAEPVPAPAPGALPPAVLDALPDAVVLAERGGALAHANRAAIELFGLDPGRLSGLALPALLPGLPADPGPEEVALEGRRADGSSFDARVAVRPHGEHRLVRVRDGGPDRSREEHLRAYTEVLERANRDLDRAREAAEQAGEAKTQFVANMSHEIRTPLTAILGFAEILLAERGEQSEADREQALRAIQRNGTYLLRVINEILHFSKLHAGEVEPSLADCSLLLLLSELRSLFSLQARERGIELLVGLDGEVPETFRSDPIFLRQALVNLVGNAVKFTEQGRVEVTARYRAAARVVEIEVADTGVGIPPEDLGRIFEPFQQVDGSRARRFGGTGLGLAIVKRLIEALGGRVQVDSVVDRGSRFRIAVPASPGEDVALVSELDDPATVTESALREQLAALRLDQRVLVVEDGPDNQRVIRHVLEKAGCEVAVAENGAVGIELARKDPPFDVILMDIQMPVLDGLEATRRLRASGYTGRIIALTAHAFDAERERALEAGCDDFATKPIDRLALLELIRRSG